MIQRHRSCSCPKMMTQMFLSIDSKSTLLTSASLHPEHLACSARSGNKAFNTMSMKVQTGRGRADHLALLAAEVPLFPFISSPEAPKDWLNRGYILVEG